MSQLLTKKELLILTKLRENSRKSLASISRETGIPISTVFEKVNDLGEEIISKYSPLLDFSKIGFGLKVNFLLKSVKKKDELKKFLIENKNVNSVLRINREFDFFVECFFSSMKEIEEFKESIKNFKIQDKREFFIIEEIKKEEFFTKPEHIEMLS